MGEARNTQTRSQVKLAMLEESGKLPKELVGKTYEQMTAMEQYQCDRNYDDLVVRKIERGEVVKDHVRHVEVITKKGEEVVKSRGNMAEKITIDLSVDRVNKPEPKEAPQTKGDDNGDGKQKSGNSRTVR